ncbi:hypothetical protein ABIG06_003536 [Bradyrhizobium sp. USDA 326]|uniref:hypothetical protein n=1 Tax=unclassified Bradyrhizobium TaxID=2631580 RepID=UPI000F5419B7|nr:hypothetical protein [Bradyrhizobium sp. RP6]RQH02248.1 hypothetical protein EHH60_36130 [Bradyrhizobium sp. RP6]
MSKQTFRTIQKPGYGLSTVGRIERVVALGKLRQGRAMTIIITSDDKIPIVIGALVEAAGTYLGAESDASAFLTKALFSAEARGPKK